MRVDDLQCNGLTLIQDPSAFRFGCDAVELADFVPQGNGKRLCDLGSGNGILAILLSAQKGYFVTAVEIQQAAAKLCQQNVDANGLSERVRVEHCAMQAFCVSQNKGAYDAVVCNPPYEPKGSGDVSESAAVRIARSEECVTLGEVIETAAHLCKYGGKFFLVHKTSRLAEALTRCSQSLLQPKRLQILRPAPHKPPHIFLLECIKNAKVGLTVLKERQVRGTV